MHHASSCYKSAIAIPLWLVGRPGASNPRGVDGGVGRVGRSHGLTTAPTTQRPPEGTNLARQLTSRTTTKMRHYAHRAAISAGPSADSVGNTTFFHLVHQFCVLLTCSLTVCIFVCIISPLYGDVEPITKSNKEDPVGRKTDRHSSFIGLIDDAD